MTLHMIGLGLGDERDISVRALDIVKSCDVIYLEYYTSLLGCPVEKLEALYGLKIIIADRNLVEQHAEKTILASARTSEVAFLVAGDVFGATTHIDLVLRARKLGVSVKFYFNASVLTAIGQTGLELYKFGKTTSMVFFDDNWKPRTVYDVIASNRALGLHTLVLLDIKVAEPSAADLKKGITRSAPPRFMTIGQCLKQLTLLETECGNGVITPKLLVVGCARLGQEDHMICYGSLDKISRVDFGKPLHCLIIPGKLHFVEEEALARYYVS